jgi:hypothetical protein
MGVAPACDQSPATAGLVGLELSWEGIYAASVSSSSKISTKGLLYHFLQRELWAEDVWLFQSLASRLILRLGIWISPSAYSRIPWLVPYARRDPLSRGSKKLGIGDQWGSPDPEGYFRDDNSLLKGVPRSMPVASSLAAYAGKQLESGFVAAHVWRTIEHDLLAARHPLAYSFIPNVVWLPADVAKLTDREGSCAQQFVQALAIKIYRHARVNPGLEDFVEEAWELLPAPASVPEHALPDASSLSFFVPKADFFERRRRTFEEVAAALRHPDPAAKVIGDRYVPGLRAVPSDARDLLAQRLEHLAQCVGA